MKHLTVVMTVTNPELLQEHEYSDFCETQHTCDDCRYVGRGVWKQPCILCTLTDICYFQGRGIDEASQEAYLLNIWKACGEASHRECKDCPVPKMKCEEWNKGGN